MKKVLFVFLFVVVGFSVFANDWATIEAERIIRDFGRLEGLLGQTVPAGFYRIGHNRFRGPDGQTIVTVGANDRINAILSGTTFWTNGEAVRFAGLMHSFVERNGGRLVQVYADGTSYHKRNLHVRIANPRRHPDGNFTSGIIIARW